MQATWDMRWWVRLGVRTLAVLVIAMALLAVSLWLLSGYLRGPVIRYVAAQSGRLIRVDGDFKAQLLSLHPKLVAERVTIGNPHWTPPGVTAEIGRLEVTYELPSFGIRRLEVERATFYLSRDETGRANWQAHEPGTGVQSTGPPLIRSLNMPGARFHFDDQRRHLKFEGTIWARDVPGQGPTAPLRVDGAGQLNDRAARFTITGDPLTTTRRDRPYRFEFTETSSGTRLVGQGALRRPYDFRYLETTFESVGEDLKDLYFLTGVRLPDTGRYRLTGKFTRERRHMEFTELEVRSGRSDMRGSVLIDAKRDAPSHVKADLRSQLLRLADLGLRAAGRAPPKPADGKHPVLSDTQFHFEGARKSDSLITFHAQALEAGHVALHAVAAKVKVGDGVITAAPISAAMRDGTITGELEIDASHGVPAADVDFRVNNLMLGEFARKQEQAPPLLDGPLQARMSLKGRGSSIHEVASNADGTVTAVLPRGALRSSLAELAGLNLRALGLMAAGNEEDTGIRCAVASFAAKDGILTAQRLLVDTEPVLMTGEGTINLDSEAFDLQLRARPKHPRLRVRAPLLVRGTFGHPEFSIEAKNPAAQAGGAIALGMLLTPVAAMLAFVDPGLAKDTDCSALLEQSDSDL